MAVWNVVVKPETKEVEIENRRHTKENRPEVAMALNAEDPRPYRKVTSPIASTINDKGELIKDDKVTPIDIISAVAVDAPIEETKP